MGEGFLIDSNAVIDFCNGKLPAMGRELMLSIGRPHISFVARIEIFGAPSIDKKEEKLLNDFVSIARVHFVDEQIALKIIEIRKKSRAKLPDAIIAATALVLGYTLITRNTSDFKKTAGLNLINPWEI